MAGMAVMLAMWAALLIAGYASREVEALNFPDQSLDELSLSADIVFVGTVTGRTADSDAEHRYTFRVDIPLKGGLEKKSEMTARVLQHGNEGVLDKGASYLVLLRKLADGGHTIAGDHQGFIKLKNGRAESRYFSQEEVDRYLARYGLKVKSIYERLVPQDTSASRRHSVQDATAPAVLWTGGLALAALLIWLFARAVRQRRYRV
jgi:hypothetical protein